MDSSSNSDAASNQQQSVFTKPKSHEITGPVKISASRVVNGVNEILGDVILGSNQSTVQIAGTNFNFAPSSKIDFASSQILNFVTQQNGDIIYQKDGVLTKLSTEGQEGKYLQVGPDGIPIYTSIDEIIQNRPRPLASIQKTAVQQVFSQTRSAIMGWTTDGDSAYFTDNQFDLATGRFIPTAPGKFHIDAKVTIQNTGNFGWRTISVRKNDTKSLNEVIVQAQGDVAIPQTLNLTSDFNAFVGDFFEIVVSHSDNDPISILPGAPTTLSISKS